MPPSSAHPYISKAYASPAGQYGYPQQPGHGPQPGYGHGQQPGGYAAAQQPSPYAQQYGGPSYKSTPGAGGYFSPSAPASAGFPNLFASTDPRNNPNDPARQEAEAAARRKLKENPLPGLPGQGGSGGMPRLGAGGMPAPARGAPGAGGIPGLGGAGMPSLDGRGRMPGLDGRGGMPAGGGMPGLAGGVPGAGELGTLPGGYGGQPATREKSKSKHTKAASTGTLPAQSHAQNVYPQYAPPTRAPKTSDPPTLPSKSSKGRLSRERDRGRSGERDKDKDTSRSRSRQRPGWDTAESLLGQPTGPDGLRGVRDGPAILHGNHHGGPTMINGVPVVNAGPQLERVPSRSKWGKITGLFTRGRRGSATSQNAPEPAAYVPPPTAPPPTTRHKSGLRNLSFDRFRRGHGQPHEPPINAPPFRGHQDRPDVGIPPGQVPVGIHVDKYGKIVDPPDEFFGSGRGQGGAAGRGRVQGFRPGRGEEEVEGSVRLDGPGRRTRSPWDDAADELGRANAELRDWDGPSAVGWAKAIDRQSSSIARGARRVWTCATASFGFWVESCAAAATTHGYDWNERDSGVREVRGSPSAHRWRSALGGWNTSAAKISCWIGPTEFMGHTQSRNGRKFDFTTHPAGHAISAHGHALTTHAQRHAALRSRKHPLASSIRGRDTIHPDGAVRSCRRDAVHARSRTEHHDDYSTHSAPPANG
ncbi:hypothetical protein FRC08_007533 [Ceratobasidium sp. 394]|nr:hypothetical protein FRC08_007533 [Ceratobasidium sp. 394]